MNQSHAYDKSRWKTPFFAMWTGQAVSLLGSRIAGFALVWWLTDTTGSATVLATGTLVAILPEILLAPIAGAYVDRWDRRRVMMAADGLVALASLWLAAMFWGWTRCKSGISTRWALCAPLAAASTGPRCRPPRRSWCPKGSSRAWRG